MNIETKLDFAEIPVGQEFKARLMVGLTAPASKGEAATPKLNLSLVLDRSGSMAGAKLDQVKQATSLLFSQLNTKDFFSLTVYDDSVKEVVSPTAVLNAHGIEARINEIRPGGMTNLSGGYEIGSKLASRFQGESDISRVLLLSDGLANQGITDANALAEIAGKMQQKGITTTTIGVGDGYNETLMGLMAEHGGGGSYFIETPEDAESVFREELNYLKGLAATDISVTFHPTLIGATAKQLNTYRVVSQEGYDSYMVGDSYEGQRKTIILELNIPAQKSCGDIEIGHIKVSYRPSTDEPDSLETMEIAVVAKAIPVDEFEKVVPDRDVTLEAAFLAVAKAKREAILFADRQQFDNASDVLLRCALALEGLGLDDPALNKEIKDLRQRAERLKFERERYYRPSERKYMYHHSDKMSKGWAVSSSMMDERRREKGADPGSSQAHGFHYDLYLANGHPVVDTEQGRILIDTGAFASFGAGKSLRLGGESFPLNSHYLGQDIDAISRLIGTQLYALIGVDILSHFDFLMDLDDNTFETIGHGYARHDILMDIKNYLGVPIVPIFINDRRFPVFLDTAARISYLDQSILSAFPVTGTGTDFFPGFGEFQTEMYSLPIKIGPQRFNCRFGVLPPTLQHILDVANVKGILGAEILKRFGISLSLRRGQMGLYRL